MSANELSPPMKQFFILPLLLSMVIFIQMLDTTILNTALPSIAIALNQPVLNMHSSIISYSLTLSILTPLSGYLSDKIGTYYLFLLAVFFFALGSLCCALASSIEGLVFARIIQGIGGALLTPVARLVLIKSFPRNKLAAALNFAVMPALIGPLLGPLVGGYLIELISWHWIFLINIPVCVICFLLGYLYMPNYKEKIVPFDIKGYMLIGTTILLFTLSFENLMGKNSFLLPITLFLISSLLLICYTKYAKKHPYALFPIKLFHIRTFRLGLAGNLCARLGISAIPFLLPLYLQLVLGYSPIQTGWFLMPMAIAGIMAKPLIQNLLSYFGYRLVLSINTIIIACFMLLLSIALHFNSVLALIFLMIMLGFCNSIQLSCINSISLSKLRNTYTSSGNSLMVVNQQLSIILGVTVSSVLLNLFNQSAIFNQIDTQASFEITFIIIGLLTACATIIFQKLHRNDGRNLLFKTTT